MSTSERLEQLEAEMETLRAHRAGLLTTLQVWTLRIFIIAIFLIVPFLAVDPTLSDFAATVFGIIVLIAVSLNIAAITQKVKRWIANRRTNA